MSNIFDCHLGMAGEGLHIYHCSTTLKQTQELTQTVKQIIPSHGCLNRNAIAKSLLYDKIVNGLMVTFRILVKQLTKFEQGYTVCVRMRQEDSYMPKIVSGLIVSSRGVNESQF